MDVLITIKPFNLENKIIRKNTTRVPMTIRKSQIDNDVAEKFRRFNCEKKGIIDSYVLYSIKPELVISFPKYEKELSLEEIISRLAKSNALISEKYGRKDLAVSPEQFSKALDFKISKLENVTLDNSNLERIISSQEKQIKDLKRREMVLKTVIDEYEDKEELEDNLKMIA